MKYLNIQQREQVSAARQYYPGNVNYGWRTSKLVSFTKVQSHVVHFNPFNTIPHYTYVYKYNIPPHI